MSAAQEEEQTLQPQTGGAPRSEAAQEAETLQPQTGTGYSSSAAKEGNELQPDTSTGYGSAASKEANELQPDTSSGPRSASTQEAETLQPADAGPVAGDNKPTDELQPTSGHQTGRNTGMELQPDEDGNASGATTTSASDTKNPVKKVMNFMKEKADKQTDGPPGLGNE